MYWNYMAKAKLDKFEQTFFSIALDEEEITLNDVNSFLRAKAEGKTLDGLSDIVGMKKEVFSSISEKAKIVLEEGNSEDDGSAELKNESDSYDADNSDIQEKGDTILNINAVKGTDSAGLEGKLDLNIDSKETLFGGIISNAENAETQVKGAARVGAQENVAPVISFPKPLNPKSVTKQIMTQVHEGEERYKDLKELGRGGMGAVYRGGIVIWGEMLH